MKLDENGQPIRPFSAALLNNYGKSVDQLIGICRGVLFDGVVNDDEARCFRNWVAQQNLSEPVFPFDDLHRRLSGIYADGRVDDEERRELSEILKSIAGIKDGIAADTPGGSMDLPLDDPAPEISHEGFEFVVTGRCAFGTRAAVWEAIKELGGTVNENPRCETKYLMIGHFASRDWLHSSYGLKIQRAVELKRKGHDLFIIAESHWRSTIDKNRSGGAT